jgi:hypothetical protein
MISRDKAVPTESISLEERRAFLQLPLEERRRRLAQQADETISLYEDDAATKERIEWQGGDVVEY